MKLAEFQVTHRDLYTPTDRLPVKDGVLDRRLVSVCCCLGNCHLSTAQGTTEKNAFCETCGLNSVDCVGHYAYIKLVVPVFHIGYFKHTIAILQCICKVSTMISHSVLLITPFRPVRVSCLRNLIDVPSLNVFADQISKMYIARHYAKLLTLWHEKSYIVRTVPPQMGP